MSTVTREAGRRLLRYKGRLAAAIVTLLGSTAATLAGPFLVGYGIDHAILQHRAHVLDVIAAVLMGTVVIGFVLGKAQINLVGGLGERFCYDLRQEVFAHLQGLSLDFYDSERTGRLVTRMTADFDALQALVQQGLIILVTNILLFAGATVTLLVLSWQLFLVCLVIAPVLVWATRRFQRDSRLAYERVRETIGQTLVTVQEGLTGVRVIQAFAREDSQVRRFASHNEAQLEANIDAVRVSIRFFPIIELSAVVTTAAIAGVGGLFVDHRVVPLGIVATFVLYMNSLFDPVQQMSQLFNQFQSSGAAFGKLLGILATEPTVVEAAAPVELPAGGDMMLEGVTFSYGTGSAVLEGVDLVVKRGEKLALVGPTGAGKSTLAKLMARLYDPTTGRIRFGGVDLRDASFESLRSRVVMVPQEGFLFRGTILDNVRIGRLDASDDEAAAALDAIGARDRFEQMEGGLGAVVEARGSTLSAGERQLVSLARAALANPDVLILDEATSSLDPGTEAEVDAAMRTVSHGRTTIVIAHRLQTAAEADRIAVVSGGGISEIGTHDDLLDRHGHYAALFAIWDDAGRTD
ncbi:MAG TPA: ABC transporter ATP-binding protein [Acidimicrobiales bacterium]|nr:ABC transporter ATP-binding protein [Acidimicrobiales bacterium]